MRPPPDAVSSGQHCWECCVAALLEMPAREVVDVHKEHIPGDRDHWWHAMVRWLWSRDHAISFWLYNDVGFPDFHYIAVGPSPRKPDITHAVVAYGDSTIWDPAEPNQPGHMTPGIEKMHAAYAIHPVGTPPDRRPQAGT